jgi:radical SAM superfamily enzyme YgiQ (UPF0313 family)
MRVSLINPHINLPEHLYFEALTSMPPIGLAYLAAALTEAGNDVEIIDCLAQCPITVKRLPDGTFRCGMETEQVARSVNRFKPDLIGIGCGYTLHAPQSYELAEAVKTRYSSQAPVVMGGAHASVLPAEVLGNPNVDYVVVGEGEGVLVDLCAALEDEKPTDRIAGLLQRGHDGNVAGDPSRPRIEDLDSLPEPRRDLLPLEAYLDCQRLYRRSINNMRTPKTTMITSRGCPGNCVFCAIRGTWGREWVGRTAENVVAEVESLIDRYGIREIDFLDDSISVSRSRLRRICELILERGIDVKWTTPNGIAIWTLDEETLRLMKKAGCYRLTFGFESGNPETLAFIRKTYDMDRAKKLVRYGNRLGMWTLGTFIVGFPYETRAQMEDTLSFARGLGLDLAIFYSANPLPGTDLHRICLEEGIDVDLAAEKRAFDTTLFTADEVERFRGMATVSFMKSLRRKPWKPLGKVRNPEDLKYTLRVAGYGLRTLRGTSEGQGLLESLYKARK